MNPFKWSIFMVIACCMVCGAAPARSRQHSGFTGFERLLTDTETIAIVQFEPESTFVFQVSEMLYPRKEHLVSYFASYENKVFGMISPDYRSDVSYPILPGGKYLVFLKRIDGKGRRMLNPFGNFIMPEYACSYRLADPLYAAVPLFKADHLIAASQSVQAKAIVTGVGGGKDFSVYTDEILAEAYGTANGEDVLSATRAIIDAASKNRSHLTGEKAPSLKENKTFKKIVESVSQDDALKKGILEFPAPPLDAAKEPPARAENFSTLRGSSLAKLTVSSFKVTDASLDGAIEQLAGIINKEPGHEHIQLRIDSALKAELANGGPKFNMDVKNLRASQILELLASGMHVRVEKAGVFVVELL